MVSNKHKQNDVVPETLPTSESSMEQVKNLLFGAEVQELNQKREQLNQSFKEKLVALEKDFKDQITQLNHDFSQQLTAETQQNKQNLQHTEQHFQQVEGQLEDLAQLQAKNHQQLEDLLNMEVSDLSKQMNDQFDQLENLIQQQINQLNDNKVSREQMADLLMTMAQSIKQLPAE